MTDSSIAKRVALRDASTGDLPAIAAIYAHYVTETVATFEVEPPGTAEWRRRYDAIAAAGLPFLVAEHEGEIAGYAYGAPWKARPAYRYTAEDSIYLAPWATGRGIGGAVLDELLARCAAAGVRELIAVITDSGDPASAMLHRGRGFEEAGRLCRVGFKHDRWLDTVLLQRSVNRAVPASQ